MGNVEEDGANESTLRATATRELSRAARLHMRLHTSPHAADHVGPMARVAFSDSSELSEAVKHGVRDDTSVNIILQDELNH